MVKTFYLLFRISGARQVWQFKDKPQGRRPATCRLRPIFRGTVGKFPILSGAVRSNLSDGTRVSHSRTSAMNLPSLTRRLITSFALAALLLQPARADLLDDYVQHLREDAAGSRKETGFLSAGSDFLYGQDYFEAGNFTSAIGYFRNAVQKAEKNAVFRYQLGAALLKTGDKHVQTEARKNFDAAFRLEPALRERYQREFGGEAGAPPAANPPAAPGKPANAPARAESLQAYIDGLKQARALGRPETSMGAPGREALYGIEYYENNAFDSAESRFRQALAGDGNNPHLNYLMAVTLAAQGKDAAAAPYLQKAMAGDPSLQPQYGGDVATRRAAWNKIVEAKQPKTTPAAPAPAPGGALVYGNYICSETIWNGPNTVPPFRSEYRGYFELKADGTYRWLDNGETGRYRYDPATGAVSWLSGKFSGGGAPRSTVYRRSGKNGLMTISFSDTLRWEVICEKK